MLSRSDRMKKNKWEVSSDEAAVLEELEELSKREIDVKRGKVFYWTGKSKPRGCKVKKGKIIALRISYTPLEHIPESIGNLIHLEKLYLNGNALQSLPETLGNLTSLTELDLANNNLETLPNSIGNLKALKKLNINANNLRSLPETISNCQSLEFLSATTNRLRNLPAPFWRLKNLNTLRLSSYGWEGDWMEIPSLNNSILKIKEFCRQRDAIRVFISHAAEDYEPYRIAEIAQFLEDQPEREIYKAYFFERDMEEEGNIEDFMVYIIPTCQILIIIATENLKNSPACQQEIDLAQKYGVKIIPILGLGLEWEDPLLSELGLDEEVGIRYSDLEFKKFCTDFYKKVIKYKKAKNVFEGKFEQQISKLIRIFKNLIQTVNNQEKLKSNSPQLELLIKEYEDESISDIQYLDRFMSLLK